MMRRKVDSGDLFRVAKAVYSENAYVSEIAVLSYRYPNVVVTMRNAFYMHGLTCTA